VANEYEGRKFPKDLDNDTYEYIKFISDFVYLHDLIGTLLSIRL